MAKNEERKEERKSEQLQIRVSLQEKELIQARAARAARAGVDVSKWVLQQVLPAAERGFQQLCTELANNPHARSHVLAELNDLLTGLSAKDFRAALQNSPNSPLPDFEMAYVAAMVEQAASIRQVTPPAWTARIRSIDQPWFASSLLSLRLHLLLRSPPPFRRRNIFVDSSIGDRV